MVCACRRKCSNANRDETRFRHDQRTGFVVRQVVEVLLRLDDLPLQQFDLAREDADSLGAFLACVPQEVLRRGLFALHVAAAGHGERAGARHVRGHSARAANDEEPAAALRGGRHAHGGGAGQDDHTVRFEAADGTQCKFLT